MATTWSPAPWLGNQTWLLTDNSVVKTPDVETSTSQRRIRIAGQDKSFPAKDVDKVLHDAIGKVAEKRGAKPWVRLGNTPDDNLELHSYAVPNVRGTVDFTTRHGTHFDPTNPTASGGTDIAFEFVSEECPTITAMVWVGMSVDYHNDHILTSGITYRLLHPHQPGNDVGTYAFWTPSGRWWTPFAYYSTDSRSEAAREFLAAHKPIDGLDFLPSRDYRKQSRVMVTDAIKFVRELMNVQTITIPVWRDPNSPTPMTFRATGRTTWNRQMYQELLDHVQTTATIERVQENIRQIATDLRSLGMVTTDGVHRLPREFLAAIERGFGDNLGCHMIPVTTNDDDEEEAPGGDTPVSIVEDDEHTVSIDFKTGTMVVHCAKDTSVIDQWNFERMKAELTGELDAFLGFARQQQEKRARRRVARIVKQRTVNEEDLEIEKFSA